MFVNFRAARLVVLSSALALAAGAAWAQQPTPDQISAVKSNCRSDYMANCMSVRPGGPEALHCLQQHLDKLSGACKSAVNATLPPPPPPPAAAAPPPLPPAAAAPPPPPPPAAAAPPPPSPPKAPAAPEPAVVAAPPPAAPPRNAAVPAPRPGAGVMEAIKSHCRSDYRAHCRRVTPGGKEALACIKRHYGELSPACRRAVRAIMPPPVPGREPKKATATAPPPPVIPTAKFDSLTLRQKILILRACHYDQDAICPSVPRGGGRIVACLARHTQALSPSCRRVLMSMLR
jgi:hypothetical protein